VKGGWLSATLCLLCAALCLLCAALCLLCAALCLLCAALCVFGSLAFYLELLLNLLKWS